ncbi:tetratricopeptide repeat protein 22-like [Styela clava]
MDDTFDIDDFIPGLFHLDLNINSRKFSNHDVTLRKKLSGRKSSGNSYDREDNIRKSHIRDLTLRYQSLLEDLNDDDVIDRESVLVFLGVLAGYLGKYKEAIQYFDDALDQDKTNLNAIAGLVFVCSKNPEMQERAAGCKKTIADLLGRSDVDVTEKELSVRLARCLAEQAYAYAFDVGVMSYDDRKQHLLTAINMYDRALTVGSGFISMEVRFRWYLSMSSIFLGLDSLMLQARERESTRLAGYNRTINLLKEATKSTQTYHTALAWSYLGILLERQSSFETTPMSIHDCGYTGCEPVDCYSKSIEIADKNTTILNRLAKLFQSTQKYELALGAADMSIQVESDATKNSSAYHVRARLRMELYVRDLSKCKYGTGSIPDRELLEIAKLDLEEILKVNDDDLATYVEIGQVCYFMGVDAFKESFIVDDEEINSALVYFSIALQCETGDILPELQLLRGKCLRIKGEDTNALECFKKSMELDTSGSTNAQAFRCLMETLLTWFSNGNMEKRDVVLSEVDEWIRLAQQKYPYDVMRNELRTLTHTFTHELLDLCKALIRSRKMTLSKLCLSMMSPKGLFGGTKSPTGDVTR